MNTPPVTVMVPLTTGRLHRRSVVGWAFVDSESYERLGRPELRKGSHGYAVIRGPERALLHREVIGARGCDVVDHIDRNPMNCTAANLRVGTQAQNIQNLPRSAICGTYPNHGRWGARAKRDGQAIYLGTYDTREQAAQVAHDYRVQHYSFTTE